MAVLGAPGLDDLVAAFLLPDREAEVVDAVADLDLVEQTWRVFGKAAAASKFRLTVSRRLEVAMVSFLDTSQEFGSRSTRQREDRNRGVSRSMPGRGGSYSPGRIEQSAEESELSL